MALEDLLRSKNCFKLVCGAGNEDAGEIEKLTMLYAKAGANYFDLSAREDVVVAAKRGLARVIPETKRNNYFFNVSVGIPGDPHVSKARINTDLCDACGACQGVCPRDAIIETPHNFVVFSVRCIGCDDCENVCPKRAISRYPHSRPFDEVIPPLRALGLDSIEFHAMSEDEDLVQTQWRTIENCFDGILSVCIDRSVLGNKQMISRVKRMIEHRKHFSTIVQADGSPMSGGDDTLETTLQALACARLVQEANLPVFLLLSGGTNSKTAKLAKQFNINAHGVAIGSFARKITREFTNRDDFLENDKIFNQALARAKWLVDTTLQYMG